jgi:uncharacterized protein YndB with AHSA1/START domain
MAQKQFPELRLNYRYAASAEHVFDSWLNSEVLKHWIFTGDSNKITNVELEEKEGGKFSILEENKGKFIDHFGKYIHIKRPESLSFLLEVPDHFEGVSYVEVNIQAQGPGCALSFIQRDIDTTKTEQAWKKMFQTLDTVLKQPYRITEESNPQDILTAVDVVAMQMTGLILPLNDEQLNAVPYPKSWTAGQLLQHITKSVDAIAMAMQKDTRPADRDPKLRIIELKQTFLDITHSMTSPDFIVPDNKNFEKRSIIKGLNQALSRLKESIENGDIYGLVEGLPMGPVTKLEMLHFVLYHIQRHLIQMKKITLALLSP